MTAQPTNNSNKKARTTLEIHGARAHNLQDLTLELPKRKLVVFTGPSGSGKSSLAFDTIYTEGRRRYVESLSTYARQFLGQLEKPDVDKIVGLSPTISIEQKTTSRSPRSTVGTITEIYDHMRVLYAKLGVQRCIECGGEVSAYPKERILEEILELPERTKFMVMAPLVRNRKGEFKDLFEDLRSKGFARARIDGEIESLEGIEKLRKTYKHDIDVVVDRLVMKEGARDRVRDAVDTALKFGDESVLIVIPDAPEDERERMFSTQRMCCGIAYPELTHQSFSFNSPLGMCPTCKGLGHLPQVDEELLVLDPTRSVFEGAIEAIGARPSRQAGKDFKHRAAVKNTWEELEEVAEKMALDLDTPWQDMSAEDRNYVLYGSTRGRRKRARGFKGVVYDIEYGAKKAKKVATRSFVSEFIAPPGFPACGGTRLRPESREVYFRDVSIADACARPIDEARAYFSGIELADGPERLIGEELLKEIVARLEFLQNVGLQYLSLERSADTLSGGESQRIRLASQLGSELSGILYVLDEPSIGLHQRDNRRLIDTLLKLRDRGNSVIVVEHDRDTMESADFLVDFGPGAGRLGGDIMACGTAADVRATPDSVTGAYLDGRKVMPVPEKRRKPGRDAIRITGARANNLKGVDVSFPKGCFICVTGVSGAGKSTLVNEILYPAVARHVYTKHRAVGSHDHIEGLELFDKVIEIDQKPIGRTPRSNPATYTKVFDHIRDLFANLPESKMYGFQKGRFSFNVAGGRCEECKGDGVKKVEMSFLADVYVPCDICHGKRFNDATLRVTYRNHTISDILNLSIGDAYTLFEPVPKIARMLKTLIDVGLDYLHLGQPSTTLSGGEAQRIKLSRELAKVATGDTLYILDEPSTGLHFDDIRKLLEVMDRLVDAGNTVVVIEHNLDIIKYADHIIDLGPEGGVHGGHIVAQGTPEEVASVAESYTGRFLKEEFER
ncbi:MAG: excinuclease ABC subunit UvrA [Myxococcota bacterium]